MITYPSSDDYVLCAGANFQVEWYYTTAGRLPAYEYFLALEEADCERLRKIVLYIASQPPGTQLPKTLYRIEDAGEKIYAFKPRDERFFTFMTAGRRIIITNAYRKHSRRMGRKDREALAVAIGYRADYLRRTNEGTYYEKEA